MTQATLDFFPATKPTCAVEGCERDARPHGYCDAHMMRIKRTGSPGSAEIKPYQGRQATFDPSQKCAEEGCDKPAEYHCGGYCQPHYRRQLKAGTSCSVEGCDKPEYRDGYCQGHWQRLTRHGDPGPAELRARRRFGCLVEGCEREHFAQGYCRTHYQRFRKTGEAGEAAIKPWGLNSWRIKGAEAECIICGEVKTATEFYSRKGRPPEQPCKECTKAERKRWRDENYEVFRERMIGYMLKFNFGISREEYDALLAAQEGGCAICGTPPDGQRLAVDHCHDTGTVRGLLCFGCNTGLGQFGEDVALMERAVAYLEMTA